MSVLSNILPTDVHADILLRAVEEGSCTRDQAVALAARESGELLYAVRQRLNALSAFRLTEQLERERLRALPFCDECLMRHEPDACEGFHPSWDCLNGYVGVGLAPSQRTRVTASLLVRP